MKLPKHIKTILWDVDPKSVCLPKYKGFLIARVAEKGNWSDIQWLKKIFPEREIRETVLRSKNTSPVVKNYWKVCLKKR